jgi:hypothetical protein
MDLSKCRDACLSCQTSCIETAIHGLAKGQPHPRDLIRLLWDCSEICATSASFMSRGSRFHPLTCRVCATLCTACAEACRGSDDPILARCAAACEDCARLCNEMAAG